MKYFFTFFLVSLVNLSGVFGQDCQKDTNYIFIKNEILKEISEKCLADSPYNYCVSSQRQRIAIPEEIKGCASDLDVFFKELPDDKIYCFKEYKINFWYPEFYFNQISFNKKTGEFEIKPEKFIGVIWISQTLFLLFGLMIVLEAYSFFFTKDGKPPLASVPFIQMTMFFILLFVLFNGLFNWIGFDCLLYPLSFLNLMTVGIFSLFVYCLYLIKKEQEKQKEIQKEEQKI
jgi:hypothetical protein